MSEKLDNKNIYFLQNIQDVLSSISSLPIKICNEDGVSVTRWSNPTFVHWLTDYYEFSYCDNECSERVADFNNIAKILSEILRKNVKETISDIERNFTFRLLKQDNKGPEYLVIPINLFGTELYVLIGGLWIINPEEDNSIYTNEFIKKFIEIYKNKLSFSENTLIFDEFQDLPQMYKNDFDRRIVSLIRSFWSIRHFLNNDIDIARKAIIAIYKTSEFKHKITHYLQTMFERVDYIDKVLLATSSPPGYGKLLLGYLLLFYRDNLYKSYNELLKCFIEKNSVPDFYLLNEEEDNAFLIGDISTIKRALKISNKDFNSESLENDEPLSLLSDFFSNENDILTIGGNYEFPIAMYVKSSKINEELKDQSEFLVKIVGNELKSMFSTIPKTELVAREFTVNTSVELLSDLSSYFRHSNEYFIKDILDVIVKTFPGIIKNIYFLIPILYEGDNKFDILFSTDPKQYGDKTQLPDEVWESFFKNLSFQTVKSKGHFYEPVFSEHRVLAILKIEPVENAWTPEFNSRMSQKLASILTYSVPYRRFVSVVRTLRDKLAKTNINKQIKDWDIDFLNEVAEELARLFTAHACEIWIFDKYENHFYRRGTAGYIQGLFNEDKLPLVPIRNIVSVSWMEEGRVLHIPEKIDFDRLAFGEELEKHGFQKGIAVSWKSSEDFGIVITMWSKLDKSWELSNDDKYMLLELTNLISDSLKVKYDLYMRNRETDEAMTSMIHEIKSPFSGVKSGVEYIDDLLNEILAPSIERICNDNEENENSRTDHRIFDPDKKCEEKYSFSKFLTSIKQEKDFITILFDNIVETKDLINLNIYPSLHYLSEIIHFMSFYIKFNSRRINLFRGRIIKVKFWSKLVNELVKRTFYIYLKEKNLKLHFKFDKDTLPRFLYMSETAYEALKLIMYNLISNAIKYSNEGTTIILNGSVERNFVIIEIINYGIGIPPGEEEIIFQKWKRGSNASERSPEGTGLGLYTSRELIRALGGNLYLKQNDKPTIFVLKIPRKYFADF